MNAGGSIPSATTLESVVKVEPMAGLVGKRLALVVVGGATAGDGAMENGATILDLLGSGGVGDGEVAVSEETTSEVLEVDVEGAVVALVERGLHSGLGLVVEPRSVGGAGRPEEVERDTGGGIAGIEGSELLDQSVMCGGGRGGRRRAYLSREGRVGDVALSDSGAGAEDVEVGRDDNGLSRDLSGAGKGLHRAVQEDMVVGSDLRRAGLISTTLAGGAGEGGQSQGTEDGEEHVEGCRGSVPEVCERMGREVMAGRRGGLYTFFEVFEKVAAI